MKYHKLVLIFLLVLGIIAAFAVKATIKSPNPPAKSTVTKTIPQTSSGTDQQVSYHISSGATPNIPLQLPPGYTIHVYASGLGTPRDLQFTPAGTLLVSDSADSKIYALPDVNHDGVADTEKVVASGDHYHGMALYNGQLFLASVVHAVRFHWNEQQLEATFDKTLFDLPGNDDHNNRTLTFDNQGHLYVSVGSTCNVCHESSDKDATVMISNANGDNPRIFAKGLRNAAFLAMNPKTNDLWGTEMGRDYLGDNTPPDEIDIIRDGKDYGWPYCYGDKMHDNNFDPANTHGCGNTETPIYEIPAHSAPLGLTFINSAQFPADWQGDLLVAYHGSWNRSVATGFKVVHMKVSGNSITSADDFLTGFLRGSTNDSAPDRPVDMAFDTQGNLYVSDDRGGNIYIIQKQ